MPNPKRARHKEARRQKIEQERRQVKRQRLVRRVAIVFGVTIAVVGSLLLIKSNLATPLVTTSTVATSSTTTSTTTAASTTTTTMAIGQSQADALARQAGCPSSTSARANNLQWSSAPAMTITKSKLYYADIVTTAGNFTISLDAVNAPKTTNNFVFLAKKNYFHCIIFHRAIPGFMVQTGDPTGSGSGGPGYSFADELPTGPYPLYSVAMANSGPNTNGSQFFIVTGAIDPPLPTRYSRFGQVTTGQQTLVKLDAAGNADPSSNGVPPLVTHRILSVTIHN
ncbi:MAG: peptidylprolyl isomerase [Actinobacteria bacterium]|nr:peptidylprolyl isomerase [Actinomycetota bacterium]